MIGEHGRDGADGGSTEAWLGWLRACLGTGR